MQGSASFLKTPMMNNRQIAANRIVEYDQGDNGLSMPFVLMKRGVFDKGGWHRISKPIFDFPGGRRFHFLDPDGYELAVWSKR